MQALKLSDLQAPDPGTSGDARRGLTRRQLLVRGVLATAGVTFGGLLLRYATILDPPAPGRRVLSADDEAITRAVVSALFPPGADLPPGDPEFILPRLDAFLAGTDAEARLLYRAVLRALEDQTALLRFTRFTRCSPEVQAEEIRAWELTPIYLKGMAFKSVKLFTGMAYFEQPNVRAAMGWYLGCSPEHLNLPTRESGLG